MTKMALGKALSEVAERANLMNPTNTGRPEVTTPYAGEIASYRKIGPAKLTIQIPVVDGIPVYHHHHSTVQIHPRNYSCHQQNSSHHHLVLHPTKPSSHAVFGVIWGILIQWPCKVENVRGPFIRNIGAKKRNIYGLYGYPDSHESFLEYHNLLKISALVKNPHLWPKSPPRNSAPPSPGIAAEFMNLPYGRNEG